MHFFHRVGGDFRGNVFCLMTFPRKALHLSTLDLEKKERLLTVRKNKLTKKTLSGEGGQCNKLNWTRIGIFFNALHYLSQKISTWWELLDKGKYKKIAN